MGENVVSPGKYGSLFAERICANSLDFPESRRSWPRIPRRSAQAQADLQDSSEPAEINLAKRLCQFAEIVPQVLNDFRPNILANYLFEVANSFHTFYEACPVLKSDEPARSSRLALCDLTAQCFVEASTC